VQKIIKDSGLLTAKPVLYLANIDEIQMSQLLTENIKVEQLEQVEKYALQQLGSADGSVRFKCHPLTPAPMAVRFFFMHITVLKKMFFLLGAGRRWSRPGVCSA